VIYVNLEGNVGKITRLKKLSNFYNKLLGSNWVVAESLLKVFRNWSFRIYKNDVKTGKSIFFEKLFLVFKIL